MRDWNRSGVRVALAGAVEPIPALDRPACAYQGILQLVRELNCLTETPLRDLEPGRLEPCGARIQAEMQTAGDDIVVRRHSYVPARGVDVADLALKRARFQD